MTALDQAFIKAFSQQGPTPVVLTQPSIAPSREARPVAAASKRETATKPISNVFRDVLTNLETPSSPSASSTKTQSAPKPTSRRSENEAVTGSWSADCWQAPFDMSAALGTAEAVCIAEPIDLSRLVNAAPSATLPKPVTAPKTVGWTKPAAPDYSTSQAPEVETVPFSNAVAPVFAKAAAVAPVGGVSLESPTVAPINRAAPVSAPVELPQQPIAESPRSSNAVMSQPSVLNNPTSTVAPLSSFLSDEVPPPPQFKPAWQVERFTWPRVCRRLIARAGEEFDRLADALMTANHRGQKVLAIAGCRRGEGATTLLLCAARQLADRGVNLVLVDADLARPRIAKRLGVQPQLGWNETSDDEGTTLDQTIIEASSSALALSSVREPSSSTGHTTGDWSRLAPSLDTLREHYEMVLVDLGPLEDIESLGAALGRTVDKKIDALLIVHNPRVTSIERLAEVEQQLTAAGVPLAGMIENFVAS